MCKVEFSKYKLILIFTQYYLKKINKTVKPFEFKSKNLKIKRFRHLERILVCHGDARKNRHSVN